MSSSQELPRRTDAPLPIPDANPAFGLDLIAWRSPGALVLRFAQVLVRVIQDKQIGFGGHGEVEDAIKLAEETEAKR